MAVFMTRITHKRLTLSPFSSEQMTMIGETLLTNIKTRISKGLDGEDQPAKPLVDRYAKRKIRYNRVPIRNLSWGGQLMRSLKVKSATENQVRIGAINTLAELKLTMNNRRSRQWTISPEDQKQTNQFALILLRQNIIVMSEGVYSSESYAAIA